MSLSKRSRYVPPHRRKDNKNVIVANPDEEIATMEFAKRRRSLHNNNAPGFGPGTSSMYRNAPSPPVHQLYCKQLPPQQPPHQYQYQADPRQAMQPPSSGTIFPNNRPQNTDRNVHVSPSVLPEFTSVLPIKQDFNVRVAIDFGTDGLALAYAIGHTNEVKAHTEWAGKKYKPKFKPKTIILLDEQHNVLGFGKEAKMTYMVTPSMKDKWLLFERFKMALYDDAAADCSIDDDVKDHPGKDTKRKIAIRETLTATNGKTVDASIVFVAAFKHLQEWANKYLKKNKLSHRLFPTLDKSDFQWIITVPAIWNDEAKYKMRQWAIDAGLVDPMIDDQCKIVYEPDCASLAIQYEINRHKTRNEVITKDVAPQQVSFRKGDKYILVDAGGGTVDIACHEILGSDGEYGVKEVLHPSGGAWGSCYIDDKYVEMLKQIFNAKWIDEFKREQPHIFVELIDNFQRAKAGFYADPQRKNHNVELSAEFIEFIESKLEQDEDSDDDDDNDVDIKDMVSTSRVFNRDEIFSLSDEHLSISNQGWRILFDHVINPTIEHIKELLNKPKLTSMGKCKYMCLAGGLSTSPYFQSRMKNEFGPKSVHNLQLIIPQRPILSVVEGAAYFGITENYIKARVLRYSYGIGVNFPEETAIARGISKEYIKKRSFKHHQTRYVRDCFQMIAHKHQEVYNGQVIKTFRQRPKDATKTSCPVLVSELEDPKIEADGHVLGTVFENWSQADENDVDTTDEFHFYDTLIKAITYPSNCPQKKQVHYISNYQ